MSQFCEERLDMYEDLNFAPANTEMPSTAVFIADITPVESLLQERGKRYGPFESHAEITQSIKRAMHAVDGWMRLSADQEEALEMIAHKIGRILNGDPNYDDSWVDIAGYATLVAKRLQGERI